MILLRFKSYTIWLRDTDADIYLSMYVGRSVFTR